MDPTRYQNTSHYPSNLILQFVLSVPQATHTKAPKK